ncbi:recombinase family protein [Paenibacillus alkaliterrae]|uniref:recombinase family protein n=1 Tax=Paenibacillus alkaliterrae TaxID=320909 RepID=UPI001F37B553|nr:recombinase family protein [Paenibacillus alkaliterrae]MCF2938951.1 recombinase family protein [Paenibacillus alkaliterrae]
MKAAIYVRVSTSAQVEEGYSLDAQIDRCKAYAVSQDWEIVETYIEEGESAKDLNRAEVKRMLSDAGEGLFDVLLVYRLDRLTRSVRDLHALLDLFDKQNIKFRSATEVYDTTTAMGRLFINIVASLAEWERANLGERVRFGKEQLVREGNWPGGVVPYGYAWDGETMHIVPEEYTTLRELRRLYMAGNGLRNTAMYLNSRGMKRRDDAIWSPTMIGYTLENPIYAGKIRFGSKDKQGKYGFRKKGDRADVMISESSFPTIYSWEEFEEHMERMNKRVKYGNSRKADYWFVGILRCARCGSKLKGSTYTNRRADGTKYEPIRVYKCYNREKGQGCNMPMLRQVVAEEMIMSHVTSVLLSQQEVAAGIDEIQASNRNQAADQEQLLKELRIITERRKKWQYMFAEDMISETDFRARKREDDEQEMIIKKALEDARSYDLGVNPTTIDNLVELNKYWPNLDNLSRKEWMQTLFDSVVIECDQETGEGAHRFKTLPFRITEVIFN